MPSVPAPPGAGTAASRRPASDPDQAGLVLPRSGHEPTEVGRRLPQIAGSRRGPLFMISLELVLRWWRCPPAPRSARSSGPRPRRRPTVLATLGAHPVERSVCWSVNVTSRSEITARSSHAPAHVAQRGGVERACDPLGHVGDVAGDPAGLRGELADVGQRGAGPGVAAARLVDSIRAAHDVGVVGQRLERNDVGRPLAEEARGGGDHRRLGGQLDARSMLRSASTQSSSARRIASTRPTFTPRSVTGAPDLERRRRCGSGRS